MEWVFLSLRSFSLLPFFILSFFFFILVCLIHGSKNQYHRYALTFHFFLKKRSLLLAVKNIAFPFFCRRIFEFTTWNFQSKAYNNLKNEDCKANSKSWRVLPNVDAQVILNMIMDHFFKKIQEFNFSSLRYNWAEDPVESINDHYWRLRTQLCFWYVCLLISFVL